MSAPYSDRVASPYPYSRPRVDTGVIRDVAAIMLVVLGIIGLSVAAFFTDWRLGLAVVSLAAGGVGVFLGYDRG